MDWLKWLELLIWTILVLGILRWVCDRLIGSEACDQTVGQLAADFIKFVLLVPFRLLRWILRQARNDR